MNCTLHKTFRLLRTLGVCLTLLAMLVASSTQVVVEECSQEKVAEEIELLLVDRKEPSAKQNDSVANDNSPIAQSLGIAERLDCRYFRGLSERDRMNGSGTYLLI